MLALVVCLALGVTTAMAAGPATQVDAGFENGADGAALAAPPGRSPASPSAPSTTPRTPRSARCRAGSPVRPTAAAAGVSAPAVMTSDGSEYRFWVYADSTNENRYISDTGRDLRDAPEPSGQVAVYTKRTATGYTTNAYTPVGTYAVGWTEYRVVLDFTNDTYTLSKRATAGDAWTQLKAASRPHLRHPHARGHRPHHHGQLLFRAYQNADMWIDDVAYADGGIVEARHHGTVCSRHSHRR